MSFLDLHAVHKSFGRTAVLSNVDLRVAAGSRTAIVGPSGSGKTTLLRIIAGFEAPDAGRVMLGGQVLADGRDAVPAHKRGIGFVPQDGALFPHLSVADNIGFGLARNMPQRRQRIAELMDMVALERGMLERRPHELSGGQQQRVALARALSQRPRLILLDEPFSALDTGLRASTRRAVAQLLDDAGVTSILVTHDQGEALSFADQVAVMFEGRLAQAGRPLDLYLKPRDAAVATLLGESIVLPAQLADGRATCVLGNIAVEDRARSGPARIMLRPEQVQFTEVAAEMVQSAAACSTDGDACLAAVTQTDFAGSNCSISLRLLCGAAGNGDGPAVDVPLRVRCAGVQMPAVGAIVRVTMTGRAHVFEA